MRVTEDERDTVIKLRKNRQADREQQIGDEKDGETK